MIPKQFQLKNTIKHPTSIIIGGLNKLGIEIADSLIKQGGYVVLVDAVTEKNISKLDNFKSTDLVSFLDYTSIPHLEDDIRRLDYVFYFNHESEDFTEEISTQEFLTISNYLDAALSLSSKFDARFLLTTSIKANQVLFATDDTAYKLSMSKSYTQAYSNMEMQRYSEGLVMEYHEKANLNTRIVRLGEIIGDGINFNQKTAFNELISAAAEGDDLYLRNDGLENEWFIHTLDAAYGLIKAQFSKDTNGEVYSLTYENTYTHLSIAYKIQELEDQAGEIKFRSEDTSAPPIKIHKPAPNLTRIGWMPRISFDRAVTQSLAAAKISVLEKATANGVEVSNHNKSVNNFQNFLSLAKGDKELVEKEGDSLKKERIKQAYKTIQLQRKQRKKSFPEKIINAFWSLFIFMARTFSFIGKMSPVEFGMFIIVSVVFLIVYVAVISPTLYISRHAITVSTQLPGLNETFEAKKYDVGYVQAQEISNSFSQIENILPKYKGAAKLVSYDSELDDIKSFISFYSDFSEGLQNIFYALAPFNQYLKDFENNTVLRKSSDGYLSIESPGKDYVNNLAEIENRSVFYEKGIQKLEKAQSSIKDNTLPVLPNQIRNLFMSTNEDILEYANVKQKTKVITVIPSMVGVDKPTTYLFLILDNTRISPLGGEIAGYALITLQNGGIVDIEVKSVDDIEIDKEILSDENLREINKRRFINLQPDDVRVSSFGSISNLLELDQTLSESLWEEYFGVRIDALGTIQLEALQQMSSSLQNLMVQGIQLNPENFLSDITRAQAGNESVAYKHEVITEVFANIFHETLNKINSNTREIMLSIEKMASEDMLHLVAINQGFTDFINQNDLYDNSVYRANTYMVPGILIEDPKVVNSTSYINTTLSLETKVKGDFSVENSLLVTFPSVGSSQEISICLPETVRLSSIKIDEGTIPSERSKVNISEDEICIVGRSLGETTFGFSWEDETFKNTESDSINFTMGIGNVNGARTELDHIIEFERGLQVNVDGQTLEANGLGSKVVLNNDVVKNIIINRQ
ncbi:hypothetical protein KC669_01090 [Candidatus Dojkabacteria bacterium]|uniref:NAD-dependent epimerase/dehydratase family protein n=1 Tax=Candidatus Dojkabacteria bacterium TaxID=2099670 RepID=A0A955RLQ4_9BACT|nr:hypothetical protein [Candidatus Dojkabacteria bacterium]